MFKSPKHNFHFFFGKFATLLRILLENPQKMLPETYTLSMLYLALGMVLFRVIYVLQESSDTTPL
ncbi:MAG: hypothetical protein OEX82_05620 [Nitrosomonas sp.]|nr:hypothetical protein [Nitrosomonas sp.]